MNRILILTAASLWGLCAMAAARIDSEQKVVHPLFSSLQVQVEGSPYAPPVIVGGSTDRIVIKFDERSDERRYMRYELIHCNKDWQPSGLLESEFLDGFNEADVDDFAYSRMAENLYTHYTVTLPNHDMRLKASGNYLVRVYDEQDPDATLLQARFYVSEQTAGVSASVTSRTDIDYNEAHQQLSVAVDTEHIDKMSDIFNELTVIVEQNGRQDNMAASTHPLRVNGKTAIYEHQGNLIFPAGNEYRRFETVSNRYPGMGVSRITRADPFYHYELATDMPRDDAPYVYDQTQHGRFTIRNYDYDDGDTDADYGIVHFSLDTPRRMDGDIYIDGDFTDRRFSPESRMTFNEDTQRYEAAMLLKQGAYNYQYLFVPQGTATGRTADIEGDRYQTVNEYVVRVYHRPLGSRADRLVGVTSIFSGI